MNRYTQFFEKNSSAVIQLVSTQKKWIKLDVPDLEQVHLPCDLLDIIRMVFYLSLYTQPLYASYILFETRTGDEKDDNNSLQRFGVLHLLQREE